MEQSKKRILMVDDEVLISRMVQVFLENRGYEVDTTNSGDSALEMINSKHYDGLITDLRMPGMNGIDLIKKVKAIPAYQNLPAILLSANMNSQISIQAVEAGANETMGKPIDLPVLFGHVERLTKV